MLINSYKFLNALLQLIPESSDLSHACTWEIGLLWLHVTPTAPDTPQTSMTVRKPHGSTGTLWGVSPSTLHPHSHPLWVPPASPSPVPREAAWAGAVEQQGHQGFHHCSVPTPSTLFSDTSILCFYAHVQADFFVSKASVQLPRYHLIQQTVIFLSSMMPSVQRGC